MQRDDGSRVLRTPPGYMRHHQDPEREVTDEINGVLKESNQIQLKK